MTQQLAAPTVTALSLPLGSPDSLVGEGGHGRSGTPDRRCLSEADPTPRSMGVAGAVAYAMASVPAAVIAVQAASETMGLARAGHGDSGLTPLTGYPARDAKDAAPTAGGGLLASPPVRTPGERGAGVSSVLLPPVPRLLSPQTKEAAGVKLARR